MLGCACQYLKDIKENESPAECIEHLCIIRAAWRNKVPNDFSS